MKACRFCTTVAVAAAGLSKRGSSFFLNSTVKCGGGEKSAGTQVQKSWWVLF